ncbi:MAG: hypothetical protein NVS1B13_08440 [Flavisolibacter sp.]
MSQNFKILFFLKKGRTRDRNSLPLYVRIPINGKRAEWSAQRNCDPLKWNQTLERATGPKEETMILNQFLDAIRANVFSIQNEYTLRNEPLNAEFVRQKIQFAEEEKMQTLLEVYSYHNTIMSNSRKWLE